ncbi:unnamed protein product [Hermetia illucens]|uniref:Major facilitator superfamily (MFS) profile domain-containing protein n=1 Tax=Hermetia illucens TaxID=343691 RepID=A0A7R8UP04_HERIL|nr:synaptic vesicular amine transporter [Hermetia illucens]CAD7084359.1 unnamed protein product [Hermetia illucens]
MFTPSNSGTTRAVPQNRLLIASLVYVALLADNILLTVVVPILPDYLSHFLDNRTLVTSHAISVHPRPDVHHAPNVVGKHPIAGKTQINFSIPNEESYDEIVPVAPNIDEVLESENGSIGLLLAMKALVQLITNPIVGNLSIRLGYRIPIVFGTLWLLLSSLIFALGETYVTLLIARAIQGIGSACIGVCGMSLVAQLYPEDDKRSRIMGVILGSIALGVLIGYPFGSFLNDFAGKSTPFYILAVFIFGNFIAQMSLMDLSVKPEVTIEADKPKWKPLLRNKMVIAIVIAIWMSTSTMAMLEPCLPIWLMEHLHPKKWQLGTVFIPDSLGYFIGTNFFGAIAYNVGQIKVSCISLVIVGLSCLLIPDATTVYRLLLPHFGLGLGIGIIDAALVPLLASFVDTSLNDDESTTSDSMSSYGTVYAIQQTSVSLAYCLAPLFGGELAEAIGFPWLMRLVGLINILYGPVLLLLYSQSKGKPTSSDKSNQMLLGGATDEASNDYKRLYNTVTE